VSEAPPPPVPPGPTPPAGAERWRKGDFADFGLWTFLDCAAQGPLPNVAAEAARAAVRQKQLPFLIEDEDYFALPEAVRVLAARLMGCDAEDVAVTHSCTAGLALVAEGLDWRAGDEVLIPETEFPANVYPWLHLRDRGVQVRFVPPGDDLAAALRPRTRVVACGHVHYVTGARRALAPLAAACHAAGALLVVDATQSIGAVPLDVRADGPDLVAAAAYKWMLGPYGTGVAYVAPALRERLRVRGAGWMNFAGAHAFNELGRYDLTWRPGARRFDAYEPACFLNLYALRASLEYVLALPGGPAAVLAHARALFARLAGGLDPARYRMDGALDAERGSTLVAVEPLDPARVPPLAAALRTAKVRVSVRANRLRVSPHLYNDDRDVDRLLDVLARAG
jgi:selenocysteine lyase/cysteine desulfurase